ncbi:hypothetical protein KXX44_000357 [Aspergillus fumigatus]|nr:hypothetical protein KXX44_000357 [Aspergillus fumigatus]KAH1640306.1 hypothetical protein KXX39_002700 [Aspergillus fumigatus]KAH1963902.1 hypothetical protein KXV90_000864 [Aspergillus fumigatus]KAH2999737.1 hypothetical protein KXV25_005207 [Aspergillus fumigatus]KAH3513436.1 hypothetical protein KXW24_006451 [Aspergillus fumigatus]
MIEDNKSGGNSTKSAETLRETEPSSTSAVSVGFWDPALQETRKRIIYLWSRTVLGLCVFILSILSLYWAVQFRSEDRLHTLTVWVVDFDNQVDPYRNESITPIVGPAVTDVANRLIKSEREHVGYEIRSPADFNFDPWAVRQGVYDEHAYAAIIVNPNATTLLYEAVTNGHSSYDPTGAAQFIIISARDQATYSNYIEPALSWFQLEVFAEFGPRWIQTLTRESMDISRVPQAVNPAIGFYKVDLRPFGPAAATPSVTIGLIYLIIIAFFNTPFLMPVHMQFIKGDHPPLKNAQWLIWRLCSSILAYFFLSLFYSFVSLAFQIPFAHSPAPDTLPADDPNAYGHGSFVVFWMLNWVGMTALGLPCENMGMILGFPYSALFLIFWVITNVATGFYALDLAPGFFAWGYAFPLHRIVEALRTILFGTHSWIGLDFGILFAWIGLSIILYPFAAFVMRWKMKRGL